MEKRPVLVGLDNPLSDDPELALFTHPEGGTGYRLWRMMQEVDYDFTEWMYLRGFERRNLSPHPCTRSVATKQRLWERLERELQLRKIVLLGAEVRDAAGIPDSPAMSFSKSPSRRSEVAWVPHPSGRNRFYSVAANRITVGRFLLSLVQHG